MEEKVEKTEEEEKERKRKRKRRGSIHYEREIKQLYKTTRVNSRFPRKG